MAEGGKYGASVLAISSSNIEKILSSLFVTQVFFRNKASSLGNLSWVNTQEIQALNNLECYVRIEYQGLLAKLKTKVVKVNQVTEAFKQKPCRPKAV